MSEESLLPQAQHMCSMIRVQDEQKTLPVTLLSFCKDGQGPDARTVLASSGGSDSTDALLCSEKVQNEAKPHSK